MLAVLRQRNFALLWWGGLIFMGVMIPLGYAVFKRIERRCKVPGTLGLH